ncbi:MAG: SCO1664 family protein [Anaerolineales bacterium]|nr:SCO1664 family protein [Anaerolineales bacterium]
MDDFSNNKVLKALDIGEISLEGEFIWGSNYTFAVEVTYDDISFQGVYKPTQGERPLWDFPRSSLAHREVAAYLVSEALGWQLVPPTVYRRKAPLGPGSLQIYVDHNPEYHYFNFTEEDRQKLRPVVLFDLLINNADRKGSHVLFDPDNHIWLIDHGVCFHYEDKLRTVIWDFAGETIPAEYCQELANFSRQLQEGTQLHKALQANLNQLEINALKKRADRLVRGSQFPNPHIDRRPYPWPAI